MQSTTAREFVFVRFGRQSSSFEPAKWMAIFGHSPYRDHHIQCDEADSPMGRRIRKIGLSEYPNSLNIEIDLPAMTRDLNAAFDDLRAVFIGSTDIGMFRPCPATPLLWEARRPSLDNLVVFPNSSAA